jgi:hypothetical protein
VGGREGGRKGGRGEKRRELGQRVEDFQCREKEGRKGKE